MLDPRIYRTGLVAVVLAVIVFAFSFRDQQGSLGATLAPDAFNGQNAFRDATNLAQRYPHRQAGSASDDAIAAEITQRLHANDFSVSNQAFQAPTPSGTRTLRNVIGVRSGLSGGSIVVIAHRDATGSPAKLAQSGTGVLLDLARVLSGETLNHTIVLASTSGSTGAAGATQLIRALDGGGPVPAPSAYLVMGGNVVPAWAVRLLVLGLILPVLGATIDAFARARRRGHPVGPWAARVLAAGVPLALGVAIVLFAKAVGLLQVAPPAAAAAGAVPLHTSGTALLVAIAGVIAIAFWLLRRTGVLVKASGDPGAAAALLIVMCALALAIWVTNPFAAALLVPALHLWMWVLMPQTRMHPALRGTLFVAGLAPPLLLLAYFMITLGYNPITFAWSGAMMIASGQISPLVALEWCAAAACALGGVAIAAWRGRQEPPQEVPVTVRGPVTYAGPGSLGGTKSALRR